MLAILDHLYKDWCDREGLRSDLSADELDVWLLEEYHDRFEQSTFTAPPQSVIKQLHYRRSWLQWFITVYDEQERSDLEAKEDCMSSYTPDGITVLQLTPENVDVLFETLMQHIGN